MTIEQFKFLMCKRSNINFFYLNDNYVIFRKPKRLWIINENKDIEFYSIEDILNYNIGICQIKDLIANIDFKTINCIYKGTGGSKSNFSREFEFGDYLTGSDYVEYLTNQLSKIKQSVSGDTFTKVVNSITKFIKNGKVEHGFVLDKHGKVLQYTTGSDYSTILNGTKGGYAVHNHPKSSGISKSDLVNFSGTKISGIYVIDKNTRYELIKKEGKFKPKQFIKAIEYAKLKGKSYDVAVTNWLKNHQSEFGYTFKKEVLT